MYYGRWCSFWCNTILWYWLKVKRDYVSSHFLRWEVKVSRAREKRHALDLIGLSGTGAHQIGGCSLSQRPWLIAAITTEPPLLIWCVLIWKRTVMHVHDFHDIQPEHWRHTAFTHSLSITTFLKGHPWTLNTGCHGGLRPLWNVRHNASATGVLFAVWQRWRAEASMCHYAFVNRVSKTNV